jgi:hypothetical protein
MDYIKHHYDLPFLEKGMKVEADGKPGNINREKNGYLEIKFDSGMKALAHPTWEIVYFDGEGSIIKDFRRNKPVAESRVMNTKDDSFGFGPSDSSF